MAKLGRIELVHNFTGETNFVIITWQSTAAPLTEIGRAVYPAPHSQESLLIEDLDPIMHLVRAYRSVNGVTLNTQINELACDAGSRSTYSSTTYEYVVNRGNTNLSPIVTGTEVWSDPVSDQNELRDERLANQSYAVFMRGLGQRRADEITDRTDDGGGFDLAISGEMFNDGDTIFVTVQNRVDATESGSGGSGAEVSGVILITEDQDFDAATMNSMLLYADYPSAVIGVLSFPNLSLITDCTFKVSTHGGLQKYLSLQLDSGDTVRFMSEDKNVVHIGKAEEMSFMVRNNVLYVLTDGTNYKRLGQRIWGDKIELNTISRDGTQYTQVSQPRMMEFVDSLAGSQVITEAAWAAGDKGKFARDDVGGTIRVPDDRGMFERAVNIIGTDVPGRKELPTPGDHYHDTGTETTNQDANIYRRGVVHKTKGISPDVTTNFAASTGKTYTVADVEITATETRPINIGLIPLLII